jgi:hypothetical protein
MRDRRHGLEVLTAEGDFGMNIDIALLENGRPAQLAPIVFGSKIEDDSGAQITPWLRLSRRVAIELYQALGRQFVGVKLREQIEVEATLAATEAHLRDVRYLLKLPHPDIIKGGKK